MFKKIIAVSTATMLTIAMSVSAFAETPGISADERALINSLPESLRDQAEAELKKEGVDLSKTNADALVAEAKALETYFTKEVKVNSVEEAMEALKGEKATEIEKKINTVVAVAKSAGIKVDAAKIITEIKAGNITTASSLSSKVSASVTIDPAKANASDNKLDKGLRDDVNNDNPDKPDETPFGADFSTTAAVVAGLGIAVVGVAVVAKKKDLVNA